MQSRGAWIALSVITGLLMIVLGGLFLARPGLSLASIILFFGIFAIGYGVSFALAGLMGKAQNRGAVVVGGVVAIIVGIVALAWPGITSLALLYVIGVWAIVSGLADITAAFLGGLSGGWRVWLVILGLLSIIVGIIFFVHPVNGVLTLLWLVGIYLVAIGALRIIDGFARSPQVRAA